MGKKQKASKMNKNLLNAKMEEKFKMSFIAIYVGLLMFTLVTVINIALYASMAEVNVFKDVRAIIGIIIMVIVVLLNLRLCRAVGHDLSATLVYPIRELQTAVRKVKDGEFDIDITYDSRDELGELAMDLRETCNHMHMIVKDTGYLLGEMAEGKFNVSTQAEDCYVGDFNLIISAINKLNNQLDGTLRQIRESAEQVMTGAEQIADSAQELADGATNQAGAIEELTATIESVTKISEESADNAVTAATSAKNAAEDAENSRGEMKLLTEAMERITETSKEIENIIEAIEDIASQTNLLSLNASIEAARAGEAGRGFAVVADQIGKLAADSALSAVSTRELISKSLTEIETGNRIVENTLEAINTVLANMEAFAGMASGAAEASKVQVDMLKQIEEGIEQITDVVQNNSATAQETSAIGEELSAQSVGLDEMVAKFVLR